MRADYELPLAVACAGIVGLFSGVITIGAAAAFVGVRKKNTLLLVVGLVFVAGACFMLLPAVICGPGPGLCLP